MTMQRPPMPGDEKEIPVPRLPGVAFVTVHSGPPSGVAFSQEMAEILERERQRRGEGQSLNTKVPVTQEMRDEYHAWQKKVFTAYCTGVKGVPGYAEKGEGAAAGALQFFYYLTVAQRAEVIAAMLAWQTPDLSTYLVPAKSEPKAE